MYTKGEWIQQGNKITAFGKGTIAICPSPTNDHGVLEFIANAHLIAAAPELYEALKDIINQAEATHFPLGADLADSINVFGRQAIAKSEVK